jgi:rhodanese-related sulfurtransferase
MSVPTITPARLAELARAGAVTLIDVRTPAEFEELRVAFARNVPLDRFDPKALGADPGAPIVVVCQSGARGQKACEKLLAAGFTGAANVEGGTLACVEAGLPVVRGRKTISLERQVRIAAGSLVLLGVGLGFVHPVLFGLAAFVGAGLVFAGITDTCGMGLLLARMPWNRRAAPPSGPTCATLGFSSPRRRGCGPRRGLARTRRAGAWAAGRPRP